MKPLFQYYLRQGGRSGAGDIGPIYHIPPFVQRVQGIGSFLGGCGDLFDPYFGAVPNPSGTKRCVKVVKY
jgi:hypothetical protein